MKLLVIAAILLVRGNAYQSPKYSAESANYQYTLADTHNAAIAFPFVGPFTTTEQHDGRYQKTKRYLCKAFGPEFLATWILAVVAGIGIVYAIKTLGTLERQTNANLLAARAAKESADILASSERALIDGSFINRALQTPRYLEYRKSRKNPGNGR